MSLNEGPRSSLAIALFGNLDVRLQGQPLPRSHSQKTQWLLALLVLQEGRAVDRAWLAGMLWPDSTEEQAAANLRRNLWYLRQALGSEGCRLETPSTGKLRLELAGADADILTFDEAIARGDRPSLEQAVTLYRGPLLQGCVEDWVLSEREAREQAYLAALETLAADATARGNHTTAVHHLRRLVAGDPLRDSARRALMQALARAGDIAAATQTYHDFRSFLHLELNTAPDAATTALYRQIRAAAKNRGREGESEGGRDRQSGSSVSPSLALSLSPSAPPRLPLPLTRLVGREQEVTEIRACLAQGPLVTLTGMGGIGKTRLAVRLAEAFVEVLPDGAWFVDLAPLPAASADSSGAGASSLVSRTVARVLGVREQPNEPVAMALVEALRDRQLLLVLDNCEHLLDACAALAQTLLEGCPHLQILTTSRQPLGLTGEIVWRVDPLSLPDDSPWEVGKEPPSAAVRLFLERAVAAAPGFRVTERSATAVAEVCRRLDGIPLAIELAATRLRALSVEELAARLEDRFRLLTQGSRAAQPRHQTLQATMAWSHDLLSEPEQTVLRRLSVFAGGWTLAAAEAVCAGPEGRRQKAEGSEGLTTTDGSTAQLTLLPTAFCLLPSDVLDLLAALVEKSWVTYSYAEWAGEGRYELLETVRQYAHDRLLEVGEAPAVRGRHRSYFLRLAEEADLGLQGREQAVWLDRLEKEHDNLHAAIDWSLGVEEGWREGLALTRKMLTYWDLRHRFGGVLGYLQRFVERSAELPIDERANLFRLAGLVSMKQGDYSSARRYFEESQSLRNQHGELDEDPDQLQGLAALALNEGDHVHAEALLQQSLRIYRQYEEAGRDFERNALGWALDSLGGIAYCAEEFPSARSYYQQSFALFRAAEDKTGTASALLGLGRVAMRHGEYATARAQLQESLALFQGVQAQASTVEVLNGLAWIGWHEGEYLTARGHLVESLMLCRELARDADTADTLIHAGHLAQRHEKSARAVRFFGAAERLRCALREPMLPVELTEYEGAITAARVALGDEAFAAAWAQGRAMTRDQAIRFALEELDSGERD